LGPDNIAYMSRIGVEEADVVIVGSRLAGTAAAVPLAREGRKVVVLDKSRFPSDQISTHVLVPSGVSELARMGALRHILALNPAKSRYLELFVGDVRVRERFTPVDGIDYGVCVPRPEQDMCLVQACREAGGDVRERCSVDEVTWSEGRASGVRYRSGDDQHEIRAKLVIGADGRRSRVAEQVGVWQPYRGSKNGRGFAFRYMDDPRVGTSDHATLGIYRKGSGTCLTLPSSPEGRLLMVWMVPAAEIAQFRADPDGMWAEKLTEDPLLAKRVEGATNMGRLRAADQLSSYYRASSGPGWALAGDAGHFKDPVVGQGQRDAMRHGRLLGEAAAVALDDPVVLDAALERWERQRDRDTLSTYHWGNRETRAAAPSLLVREVFRTFEGDDSPNASDTFNRQRKVERIIGPLRLGRATVRALATRGADRREILAEVAAELPIEVAVRRETWFERFRYCGPSASEHPGWDVGAPPIGRSSGHDEAVVLPKEADETASTVNTDSSGQDNGADVTAPTGG
jgi:2-polyprenyl-6-methoxyphenol hydroxylase-like FAD-dependent oxidoreductase